MTLLCQDEREGYGEGLDLGVAYLTLGCLRDEAVAERVELVSGRNETETWKEVNAASLPPMFKTFRKEFAAQLSERFKLDTMPSKHVMLSLKLNPSINLAPDSPLLAGKSAMAELMDAEYTRALRRQAIHRCQATSSDATSPTDRATPAPVEAAPGAPDTPEPDAAAPDLTAPAAPGFKRRKGLLGMVVAQQSNLPSTGVDEQSTIDKEVKAEMESFRLVRETVLESGQKHELYEGSDLFNLRKFWAKHKTLLPLHFAVYVAEVAPKKAAAANVETVFSGAGKFMEEAKSTGPTLLQRMTRLHYNWKYEFLRPTIESVVARYKLKFQARSSALDSAPNPLPAGSSAQHAAMGPR